MKAFIALAAIALVAASVKATENKAAEKIVAAFNKCKESHPISDAEVEMIKKHEIPSSREAKCLMACVLKDGKLLKDGVYSKDNALLMADVLHKDNPDEASRAREVVETCSKEVVDVDKDECEFAAKLAACTAAHAKRLNVTIPTFSL